MTLQWVALGSLASVLFAQSDAGGPAHTDSYRMEILLDRFESSSWKAVDPGLVLDRADRVRFRFRTNFDGYLYVLNRGTSGKSEQLFPREETGQQNAIRAGQEYQVPATETLFRIDGPAGYEVVSWLVSPVRLADGLSRLGTAPAKAPKLLPRCDDTILRARGDCIDNGAGVKLRPRDLPSPNRPDLLLLRQQDSSVITAPLPLDGPVVYEFHLAHR
jgi:Domain of unknown function (DUF4384)